MIGYRTAHVSPGAEAPWNHLWPCSFNVLLNYFIKEKNQLTKSALPELSPQQQINFPLRCVLTSSLRHCWLDGWHFSVCVFHCHFVSGRFSIRCTASYNEFHKPLNKEFCDEFYREKSTNFIKVLLKMHRYLSKANFGNVFLWSE